MEDAAEVMTGLVERAARKLNASGKELIVCGELAADVNTIPLLLRAGVRSLSVSTIALDRVRECVAGVVLHR